MGAIVKLYVRTVCKLNKCLMPVTGICDSIGIGGESVVIESSREVVVVAESKRNTHPAGTSQYALGTCCVVRVPSGRALRL
jgi:hypothetical protein